MAGPSGSRKEAGRLATGALWHRHRSVVVGILLPYPAASLPPGPQNRTHVMTSLSHQTTRLEAG
jgi:hypothetical protein